MLEPREEIDVEKTKRLARAPATDKVNSLMQKGTRGSRKGRMIDESRAISGCILYGTLNGYAVKENDGFLSIRSVFSLVRRCIFYFESATSQKEESHIYKLWKSESGSVTPVSL